jgi:predicted Zn-dependent protease
VKALIDGGALLNPDKQVDLLRGRLALALGETRRAQAIFLKVSGQEPMDVRAWSLLGQAAGANRSLALLALARVRQLEPPVRQAP